MCSWSWSESPSLCKPRQARSGGLPCISDQNLPDVALLPLCTELTSQVPQKLLRQRFTAGQDVFDASQMHHGREFHLSKQMRTSLAGECQGLAEELEEARKVTAETERERDEAATRADELALQLADVTAACDALTCAWLQLIG